MRHSRRQILRYATGAGIAALGGGLLAGCGSATNEVVLYTSVDQPIAAKVVAAFEQANPTTKVRLVADTEASKSIGLATRLRAERANPICHVWWGNEVFYTIGLAADDLLATLPAEATQEIAPAFKDDAGHWASCGLRARVLAIHESAGATKDSIFDLLDPRFAYKAGVARPLTGTTGGHVAALYALWGEAKADGFFRNLHANNAIMLGGNSAVAEQVASGNLVVGLTDNDDVANVQQNGGQLRAVLPDQGVDGIGTLALPTTVALVRRKDQPPTAVALATFLLSTKCEQMLLDEKFAAYSVRAGSPMSIKTMDVRYEAVAKLMQTVPKRVADILDGRT